VYAVLLSAVMAAPAQSPQQPVAAAGCCRACGCGCQGRRVADQDGMTDTLPVSWRPAVGESVEVQFRSGFGRRSGGFPFGGGGFGGGTGNDFRFRFRERVTPYQGGYPGQLPFGGGGFGGFPGQLPFGGGCPGGCCPAPGLNPFAAPYGYPYGR
jgi:hypothetical protein